VWNETAASVSRPNTPAAHGNGLATTGAGVAGIAAISGILSGIKHMRRKRKFQADMEPVWGLS
jgi:hypothetical protein